MSGRPRTLADQLLLLEDDATFEGCAYDASFTPERRIALSTAISLKRIADSLDRVTDFRFDTPAILTRRSEL